MKTPENQSLLTLAKSGLQLALKKGAKDAVVTASRERDVSLDWRDGKTEKTSEATSRSLSFTLYVDGRYSVAQTTDLRPEALERFVEEAVATTRVLTVDPYRTLPDPALYAGRSTSNLQIEDPRQESLDMSLRQRIGKELEDAARSVKGADRILSVSTSFGDWSAESARVSSNGFVGERRQTGFSLGADVSVKDADGRRPEDGDYASARFLADLPSPREVGTTAALRTLERLGSKKAESGQMPMVVVARSAMRLLRYSIGPLNAGALQQKRSFYDGKLGTTIASKEFSMKDDPLLPKGLASRAFDNEGIAAKPLAIVEAGVLRAFYVDTYYGKKLGMAPTTAGASNLTFALGTKGLDGLLADVKEAIVVTSFLGGNSNDTTGDFSLGVQGYRVRKGERAEPVGEMNISGNHLTLLKALVAVGNDPHPYSSARTPTLVFDGVQFAGK